MKWFLIQSIFLAALAFGLGALFHRLTWRKTSGASESTSTDINRFGGATDGAGSGSVVGAAASGSSADLSARTCELNAIKAEHAKLVLERDANVKELSALSFAHGSCKTTLAERDASLASLTTEFDAAKGDHDGLVQKVRAENDASVAQLRLDHEGSLDKVTSEHKAQLQGFAGSQEKAVADSGAAHAAALGALAADHERRVVTLRADHARLTQEVHGERDRTLSGLRGDHEKALAALRRRSDTAEAELTKARTEADGHKGELEKLRTELEGKHAEVQSFAATEDLGSDDAFEGSEVAADDLLRIEGVGPKISELLMAGGVRTFRRLAAMPEDSIRSIVNAGGISFVPSIGSWAAQAALLRDGDEAGFQALVDKLVSGRDEAR